MSNIKMMNKVQARLAEKQEEFSEILVRLSDGLTSANSDALENTGYRDALMWVLAELIKEEASRQPVDRQAQWITEQLNKKGIR